MRQLSGPTWRRLKSCLEHKFDQKPVPTTGHEDSVKTLGLLMGLSRGDEKVLKDESLQFRLGGEASAGLDDQAVQDKVHRLTLSVPIERYLQ